MSLITTDIPNIDEIAKISISYCLLMVGTAKIISNNRGEPTMGDILEIDLSEIKVDASNTIPLDFKLGFKWYRNGEEIVNATSKTYTITSEDLGCSITAEVIALEENFEGNIVTPEVKIQLTKKEVI